MNQGKQANKTGRTLENQIYGLLKDAGYKEILNKDFKSNTSSFADKYFVKHRFIGYSIYQTKLYADVYLVNGKKKLILGIEIKWVLLHLGLFQKRCYKGVVTPLFFTPEKGVNE